jgi:protein-S-isoprenylcysteine O-methyltransferase Ste14
LSQWESFIYRLNRWVLSSVAGVLTVLQIILCLFLPNRAGLPVVKYAGLVTWSIGAIFGIMPIFALRRKGGIPEGKGYIHTTTLVDTGIYAVVRHPQGGTAWILLSLACILIGQTWLIAILGVVTMALVYLDALKADQYAIEKFGEEYKRYMQTVPRINFLSGIIRFLRKKDRK